MGIIFIYDANKNKIPLSLYSYLDILRFDCISPIIKNISFTYSLSNNNKIIQNDGDYVEYIGVTPHNFYSFGISGDRPNVTYTQSQTNNGDYGPSINIFIKYNENILRVREGGNYPATNGYNCGKFIVKKGSNYIPPNSSIILRFEYGYHPYNRGSVKFNDTQESMMYCIEE